MTARVIINRYHNCDEAISVYHFSQTAELVYVTLDIFLGTNFSAPGMCMCFITTFAI